MERPKIGGRGRRRAFVGIRPLQHEDCVAEANGYGEKRYGIGEVRVELVTEAADAVNGGGSPWTVLKGVLVVIAGGGHDDNSSGGCCIHGLGNHTIGKHGLGKKAHIIDDHMAALARLSGSKSGQGQEGVGKVVLAIAEGVERDAGSGRDVMNDLGHGAALILARALEDNVHGLGKVATGNPIGHPGAVVEGVRDDAHAFASSGHQEPSTSQGRGGGGIGLAEHGTSE